MNSCKKCGTALPKRSFYCRSCGTPTPEQHCPSFVEEVRSWVHPHDVSDQFSAEDIGKNKGMAVLSYIGLLVLIPLLAARQSKFARFHANQGLVLLILSAAYQLVRSIFMVILRLICSTTWHWSGSVIFYTIGTITALISLGFLALLIFGVINAANGRAKTLPLIGKITLIKIDESL